MSVSSISKHTDSNIYTTPRQLLNDVAQEIDSGEIKANRMLIICLEETDELYNVGFRAANISCSTMITVCDLIQSIARKEMGYE